MALKRLSILGVGLLGGSIGLAVKQRATGETIIGYGHRAGTLDEAVRVGAIDGGTTNAREAVNNADLVILCTPVGLFERLLTEIATALPKGAIVTDVGSTKRNVAALAERILPREVHFVGSHPMAGSEKRGVQFASADLFEEAVCITTPTDRTDPTALEQVEALWRRLGMTIRRLPPQEHDRRLADVSHLPHALAAALVRMQEEGSLDLAGNGFRDMTRIAAGDGGLWRDILFDNRDNLRRSIERLRSHLDELLAGLESEEPEVVKAWLDAAAARRLGMRSDPD